MARQGPGEKALGTTSSFLAAAYKMDRCTLCWSQCTIQTQVQLRMHFSKSVKNITSSVTTSSRSSHMGADAVTAQSPCSVVETQHTIYLDTWRRPQTLSTELLVLQAGNVSSDKCLTEGAFSSSLVIHHSNLEMQVRSAIGSRDSICRKYN